MTKAEEALKSIDIAKNELANQVVNMIDYLTQREYENLINGLPEDVAKLVLIKIVRKFR